MKRYFSHVNFDTLTGPLLPAHGPSCIMQEREQVAHQRRCRVKHGRQRTAEEGGGSQERAEGGKAEEEGVVEGEAMAEEARGHFWSYTQTEEECEIKRRIQEKKWTSRLTEN